MRIGKPNIGSSATPVSIGLMRSIMAMAKSPPATVFTMYMIAGPAAMRMALRSLVSRAIRSPVRHRRYQLGSSAVSRAKMSWRRSVSICRLTPLSKLRIRKRRTPLHTAVTSITPAICHRVIVSAPLPMVSTPRRSNDGMTLASAAATTTANNPTVTCVRYGW